MRRLEIIFVVLLLGVSNIVKAFEGEPERLKELPGNLLVELLLDEEARSDAYYELYRRQDPNRLVDPNEFYKSEYQEIKEVIVCPQEEGIPSLYMVVNKSWTDEDEDDYIGFDEYFISDSDKLFGREGKYLERRTAGYDLFTSEGEFIKPDCCNDCNCCCGNFLSEGFIFDLNKDELIELVEASNTEVEGMDADFLMVSVVSKEPKYTFAILYNWIPEEPPAGYDPWEWWERKDKEKWSYDGTDRDEDGLWEIEIGPISANGVEPNVVFKWDVNTRKYVSNKGEKGEHFYIFEINEPNDIYIELKRLAAEDFEFKTSLNQIKTSVVKVPEEEEYEYSSLKGLTNEEIIKYMGEGKQDTEDLLWFEKEPETPTHVPDGFWKLEAKKAALVMAEENRLPEHKKLYRLAIDDIDGRKPPEKYSVMFSNYSISVFQRCEENESYLIFLDNAYRYMPMWEVAAEEIPNPKLYYIKINYDDAKYICDTIWWLNRVRSYTAKRDGSYGSSYGSFHEGFGHIKIITGEKSSTEFLRGTICTSGAVSDYWQADYDKNVCMSLVNHIMQKELPIYMNLNYSEIESEAGSFIESPKSPYEIQKVERFKEHSLRILDLFSLDEDKISFEMVEQIINYISSDMYEEFEGRLLDIYKQLPVMKEYEECKSALEFSGDANEISNIENLTQEILSSIFLTDASYKLLKESYFEMGENEQELIDLREEIQTLILETKARNDLELLYRMAKSRPASDPYKASNAIMLSEWAGEQIKEKDKQLYLEILEDWMKKTQYQESFETFEKIAELDPERAEKIARSLRPEDTGTYIIAAFKFLEGTSGKVSEEEPIFEALIRSITAPKIGGGYRGYAIETLVPTDEPNRYKTKAIDEVLLSHLENMKKAKEIEERDPNQNLEALLTQLFNGAEANELPLTEAAGMAEDLEEDIEDDMYDIDMKSLTGDVCKALARRDGERYFDNIKDTLESSGDNSIAKEDILSATVYSSQVSKNSKHREELLRFFQQNLRENSFSYNKLLWAIWSSDIQELKPELEQISTSGPDVREGNSRVSPSSIEQRGLAVRFHLARKVVSIWNEEDTVTKAKLLIALGFEHTHYTDRRYYPERSNRLEYSLSDISEELNEEQLKEVLDFIRWRENYKYEDENEEYSRDHQESRTTYANFLRQAILDKN
ncbi:MAG: hypothetical protein ACYSSP_02005 [Planctomycetota bacterium]|jgi:hypothetical protein